jgi:mRNA-degrading endonuclease toxin of MazEF toxin-antitoxin module
MNKGDIYFAKLFFGKGHQQGGVRPVIIYSQKELGVIE